MLKLFPDLEEYDPDPWETVLHRCDDSAGCCADKSSSCNVSTTENVTLVFFSVGKSMLVTRDGVNHTSCSCQPLKSAIK
ncbi:hypothetical protein QE152_g10260 [Popillia japonica]|uniref:Platelet-derived growth factor (PDGF) family profile domain-containing protein n=1 Tax=Popillia japonica TaxID=7064 RepID=A0AAW1LVB7_POPJA